MSDKDNQHISNVLNGNIGGSLKEPTAFSPQETFVQNEVQPEKPIVTDDVSKAIIASTTNPMVNARLQEQLNDYCTEMAPGRRMTLETLLSNQSSLFAIITQIMKLDYPSFRVNIEMVLDKIYEHRDGCFSDLYVRRGFDFINRRIGKDNRIMFDRILSLLTTVGRVKNRRRALSQVDITKALADIRDQVSYQQMYSYFNALRGN